MACVDMSWYRVYVLCGDDLSRAVSSLIPEITSPLLLQNVILKYSKNKGEKHLVLRDYLKLQKNTSESKVSQC